ncbi:hypothetical protein AB3Z07_24570 [Metabacillus halosaccharovorans]|uniref:hypothetical protein n=1 Tax=Metabacillus halosaccharovorans TaxID=930124 RepID=UPI0034CFD312
MKRRHFLINFFLWILAFLFGYKIRNFEISDLNYIDKKGLITSEKKETLNEKLEQLIIYKSATLNIPSDYKTLQDAIDDLSTRVIKHGAIIYLNIESGHKLTDGLDLRDGDFSSFRIIAEDKMVEVDKSQFPSNRRASFYFQNCHAPSLQCMIDLKFIGRDGWYLRGSRGEWWSENEKPTGITHAGEDGLVVDQASDMRLMGVDYKDGKLVRSGVGGAVFRCVDNNRINLHVHGSVFQSRKINAIKEVDFSNSISKKDWEWYNILIIHGSMASIEGVKAVNSNGVGLAVRKGSSCDAGFIDVSNAKTSGILVDDSSICNASEAIANNCNEEGFTVRAASSLNVIGATSKNCKIGVEASTGSKCSCNNAILSNNNLGVVSGHGSSISANNVDCSNAKNVGIFAYGSSQISAGNSNASGAGENGVRAKEGSNIFFNNSNAQKGVSPSKSDIVVSEGSVINASGARGGISENENSLTGNGIIYK